MYSSATNLGPIDASLLPSFHIMQYCPRVWKIFFQKPVLDIGLLMRYMGDTVNANSCEGFQSAVNGPLVDPEFYSGGPQTDASLSLKQ